ncbi:glycoside hydrolase family 76 protein [Gordonia sp. CPCC 206044]
MTANDHAAAAAESIIDRHLGLMFGIPGTRLAAIAWPTGGFTGRFGSWHYWWHAHLVDLLVDAAIHRPSGHPRRHEPTGAEDPSFDPEVADVVIRLLRGIRWRNLGRWTNNYYDDMAWLGLAIERADRHLGLRHTKALNTLSGRMVEAWLPHLGGGIPWRTMDLFFNAPANGPASILVARTGHVERARAMADWMDATLIDPASGLVIDGVKPGSRGGPLQPVPDIYTYCQGVVLGVEVELARRTDEPVHVDRIERLLTAVETHVCTDGVVHGAGGGDGGLFAGVLARYLALIATDLPGTAARAQDLRRRAAAIVTSSAEAAWTHRVDTADGPFFGPDWRRPATTPRDDGAKAEFVEGAVHSSQIAERDLSVQLSGWMALEAAAAVELHRPEHTPTITK